MENKINQDANLGPYTATKVRNNGTVCAITCATSPFSKNRNDFNYGASMSQADVSPMLNK